MRVPCEHGRWDAHGIRPAHRDPGPTRCPGGREPTRQELWAYAKSKGWIDYQAACIAVFDLPLAEVVDDGPLVESIVVPAVNAALGMTGSTDTDGGT